MALTHDARKALILYVSRCATEGKPARLDILDAVRLTEPQQLAVQKILCALWNRADYKCPSSLSIKPRHGYESRVLKDRFPPSQYCDWLEIGCSDSAEVSSDGNGRPRLIVSARKDFPKHTYTVVVPIRSDAHGRVYIDDVIPDGLPSGATK